MWVKVFSMSVTSRNGVRKIMQSIGITSRPLPRDKGRVDPENIWLTKFKYNLN